MSIGAGLMSKASGGDFKEGMKGTSLAYGMSGMGAAEQNREAAEKMAAAQQTALDYMMQAEGVPQQYKTQGIEQLGAMYGMGTPEESTAAMERFKSSPMYGLQMEGLSQGIKSGEESIARHASMTGGLRGGNIQSAFADVNTRLTTEANQTAMDQYLSGLGGFANLRTNPGAIADRMTGITGTEVAGDLASYEAMQEGTGNVAEAAGTLLFSDVRLKTNVKYTHTDKNGHRRYKWDWNKLAEKLGLTGSSEGVIAHLVRKYLPAAIGERDGYLTVNYPMLRTA